MKNSYISVTNRILLGLLMLLPGLAKLFVVKPSGVIGMLTGLGFPVPLFFAWILILSEIVFGLAVLLNWKLEYTVWPPIVILIVAAFTTQLSPQVNIPGLFMHLVAASNFWLIGSMGSRSGMMMTKKK